MRKSPFARMSFKVIACALAVSFSGAAFGQVKGDVNADGIVNLIDAAMIKDHLLERKPLTGSALTRADTDADGKVRMADVVWVLNHQSPSTTITVNLPGNVPLVLGRVPAGNFQMGSPDTERSRYSNEGPVHTVNIAYNFYMGKYELTQKQWLAVMGSWLDTTYNPPNYPQYGLGDNYPATLSPGTTRRSSSPH